MDLRQQLEIARARIIELEQELETYKKADRITSSLAFPAAMLHKADSGENVDFDAQNSDELSVAMVDLPKEIDTVLASGFLNKQADRSVPCARQGSNSREAKADTGISTEQRGEKRPQNEERFPRVSSTEPNLKSRRVSNLPAPAPVLAVSNVAPRFDSRSTKTKRMGTRSSSITPPPSDDLNPNVSVDGVSSPLSARSEALSNSRRSSTSSPQPENKSNSGASSAPRRRPPPLPNLGKSSNSKKERSAIVAKITEPRQGQTRYWTEEEHERFLEAVAEYGEKAYVAISNYVETRTPKQVRTHAQKFQMKMARLAKQSYEAGQPIQLPPGMLPIYPKLELENKVSNSSQSGESRNSSPVSTISKAPVTSDIVQQKIFPYPALPLNPVEPSPPCSEISLLGEATSSVSGGSSADLSDPYLSYIGGEMQSSESELEDTFAAKLSKTLQTTDSEAGIKRKAIRSSNFEKADSSRGSTSDDDDLEDLEECGELPMSSLSNFGI